MIPTGWSHKKLKVIFLCLLGILGGLILVTYLFLAFKAKPLLEQRLSHAIGRPVTISGIFYFPPHVIGIKDLKIKDLLTVEYASFSPSILGLTKRRVFLNYLNLIRPHLKLVRDAVGNLELIRIPKPPSNPEAGAARPEASPSSSPWPVMIAGLKIKGGSLVYEDKKLWPNGGSVHIKDIDFSASRLSVLPVVTVSQIRLKGFLDYGGNKPPSLIEAEGWIDFQKKDMQAWVEGKKMDGSYFIDLFRNSTLDSLSNVSMDMRLELVSVSNDLAADCFVKVNEVAVKGPSEASTPLDALTNLILAPAVALGPGQIKFSLKTKMDHPRLEGLNVKGILGQPQNAKSPEEVVQQAAEGWDKLRDEFKELGDKFKGFSEQNDEHSSQ